MKHHANFRALKDSTYDDEPVRRARGGRTNMKVAGNPDVFKEAEGEEDYASGDERKKGGRARRKSGGKPRKEIRRRRNRFAVDDRVAAPWR
jgi:hypothetical protein